MRPELTIRPLAGADDAEWCARLMSSTEPWITLRRDYDQSLQTIRHPQREVYLGWIGDQRVGFVIICMVGAFTGYLQSIIVSQTTGAAMASEHR